jgi:uncharacterized membrane-anchored protein
MWTLTLSPMAYALDQETVAPAALEPDPYELTLAAWLVEGGATPEKGAADAAGMMKAERELPWATGVMPIGDEATLTLGEGDRWIGPAPTSFVLEMWGNPPRELMGGMVLPAGSHLFGPHSWAVLVDYVGDGWVDDSEAAEIDYDDLLVDMKEGMAASAEERRAEGFEGLTLVEWAEPPHYDSPSKVLYWAQHLRSDSGGTTLNYDVRVLGRGGVLSLNAIADMKDLPEIRPAMERVRHAAAFVPGRTYADYQPGVDPVAAYGLAALVAGGALAGKAGLFKVLIAAIIAGKKFILIGAVALFGILAKVVGGRRKSDPTPPTAA